MSPEHLLRHLSAKQWWLPRANVVPLREALAELRTGREIDNLCPDHGRPIVGRAATDQVLSALERAFDLIERAAA